MTDETDNPDSGTDNVNPSEPDTAPEWDYYDPDEDQDTEVAQEEATDEGPEPADEDPQPEDDDEPIEAVVDRIKAENPKLAAHLAELEQGALRQADYTRKAQEVATRRKALEADVSRSERFVTLLIDELTTLMPEPPDEILAHRDPAAYVRQKAVFDSAMTRLTRLRQLADEPKKIAETMSQADRETLLRDENARLMERFPVTRSEKGRMEFFRAAASAAEELGYSAEELGQQTDHRAFALAYWARKGMDAAKSKDKAADAAKGKEKVAAAPRRPSLQSQAAAAAKNREAMKRLSKTGSLKDALAIDWD